MVLTGYSCTRGLSMPKLLHNQIIWVLISIVLSGCALRPKIIGDESLLDFLQDGITHKEIVLKNLGEPTGSFVNESVLTAPDCKRNTSRTRAITSRPRGCISYPMNCVPASRIEPSLCPHCPDWKRFPTSLTPTPDRGISTR